MNTAIRTLESGLLKTSVFREPQGARWVHHVGEQAPLLFVDHATIPLSVQQQVGSGVVFGSGSATMREYHTAGAVMMLDLLTVSDEKALAAAGTGWGLALKELHAVATTPDHTLDAPRTLHRAQVWLNGWEPAQSILQPYLPILHAWVEEMRTSGPVLTHGYPGMAHWVTQAEGTHGALLTGEDLGVASRAYDLTWVLGEIAELRAFYPQLGSPLDVLEENFRTAYGLAISTATERTGIAYRLIHHAYDWHHYAGASIADAQRLVHLATHYLHP